MSEQNPENSPPGAVRRRGGAADVEATNRRERLAAAAEQRRTQRAKERERAAEIGLDTGERVDDALSRAADSASRFIRRNFGVMQWVIVGGIAVWIGYQIYLYRTAKSSAKVGDTLSQGAAAVLSQFKSDDTKGQLPDGVTDPTPHFDTDTARIKAARDAFDATISLHKTEGSVAFANLGLAGLQFDEGKFAEARASYEKLKADPAAQKFPELKGRALEGIALTYEGAADSEGALKAYRELENAGIDGFVEMAQLAQARLLAEKGDLAGAKDALDKLSKRLEKAQIKLQSTLYIAPTVAALQLMIDPTGQLKAQSEAQNDPLAKLKQLGGGTDMEALKKTLQELAQKAGKGAPAPLTTGTAAPTGVPNPGAPKPEGPAPTPAAPTGTNPQPAPGKQGDPAE